MCLLKSEMEGNSYFVSLSVYFQHKYSVKTIVIKFIAWSTICRQVVFKLILCSAVEIKIFQLFGHG